MAKYFNKCLAIYKIIWPFHIILCIKIDQVLRKRAKHFYIYSEMANFGWKMANGWLLFWTLSIGTIAWLVVLQDRQNALKKSRAVHIGQ